MREFELIESKELRNGLMDRIDVLDKVKGIMLLPSDLGATTEMVANYFEVDIETIQTVIKRNKEELSENGLRLAKKSEFLNVHVEQLGFIPNRGLNVFTVRAILNVAMLLRDSVVAKEIRKQLLDVMETKEAKEVVVNNVETEKDLTWNVICATTEEERLVAVAKLKAFKDSKIKVLEETIEEQQPKVDKYEHLMECETTFSIEETAKQINMVHKGIGKRKPLGRTTLFKVLKELDVLMWNNVPYQKYINKGWFEVKVKTFDKNGIDTAYSQTRVTTKGIEGIIDLLSENGYEKQN